MADPDPVLAALARHREAVAALDPLVPEIRAFADDLVACLAEGGLVCWCGNGGSAAEAQHLSAELVVRLRQNRRALASIALTVDTSVLTAQANDRGFEGIFARQVEALAGPRDCLVCISTSGGSANVCAAARAGHLIGARVLGLTGSSGGALAPLCNRVLRMPSDDTACIQECHSLVGHIICDLVEAWAVREAP